MSDLVEAMVEFANAHPALTDSTAFGGSWLWLGRAPGDTALPYGTITTYTATPTFDSGEAGSNRGSVEAGSLTLAVYSTSRANCGRLAKLVRDTLTDAPLAFSAGSLMHLRPGSFSVDLDPDPGPAGEDVWQAVTTFEFQVDAT